jgi:hypothetical protein
MFVVLAKKETSIESQIEVISKIKKFLKKDKVVHDICKDYNKDISDIDGISISFEKKLDVTAKTIDGKVFLNTSLMDEKFEIICRYVVHELTHVFQHMKKEFSKNNNGLPAFKGAIVDKSYFSGADQLDTLMTLKTKNELIGEVIGLLQSPIKNVVSGLKASGSTIAGIVKTLSER